MQHDWSRCCLARCISRHMTYKSMLFHCRYSNNLFLLLSCTMQQGPHCTLYANNMPHDSHLPCTAAAKQVTSSRGITGVLHDGQLLAVENANRHFSLQQGTPRLHRH